MVNNMNEKCRNCKHLGMRLPCTVSLWNNDFYEPLAPTSPPEMPTVDPSPDFPEAPVILGKCVRFHQLAGKKKPGSCVGCTVGCPGKGKQEPKGTLECKVIGCYDLNKTGTCMREEGPCNRQEIP